MEESEIKINSNKNEGGDEPLTIWERLFGFLVTWDLRINLIIWLIFVMTALVLSFLLMILSF